MLPYQGDNGFTILKTLSKELKTLPENIKTEMIYTGAKLGSQFNIKDPIPERLSHNIIYHTVCPEYNYNEDYTGECKDHNGRGKISHMLSHSIESGLNEVSESDFQITGKGYSHHT